MVEPDDRGSVSNLSKNIVHCLLGYILYCQTVSPFPRKYQYAIGSGPRKLSTPYFNIYQAWQDDSDFF